MAKVLEDSILIIGAGNMGGALARGLLSTGKVGAAGPSAIKVRVHDVHAQRLAQLAGEQKIEAVPDLAVAKLTDRVIALCVKPQDLDTACAALKGRVPEGALVITILAGVATGDVEAALKWKGAVVRAMPNIAATVHAAATAMCANERATEEDKAWAERIFGAIGTADWTREALLDAVTGLSGSGPAYAYMVIEALTDGGVKMGIPRALAARLATQTVLGAAMLVKDTGLHPAILRDQVTTPGGTTINAIHELESRGLRAMLISAVETATNRAAFLRKK